ncbi:hypothetical protein BC829DRAFT_434503 [Chytridium lagenaria]|nr:hypothetical protein BC829DRAFT_434503 [Chytridium lagenaria]
MTLVDSVFNPSSSSSSSSSSYSHGANGNGMDSQSSSSSSISYNNNSNCNQQQQQQQQQQHQQQQHYNSTSTFAAICSSDSTTLRHAHMDLIVSPHPHLCTWRTLWEVSVLNMSREFHRFPLFTFDPSLRRHESAGEFIPSTPPLPSDLDAPRTSSAKLPLPAHLIHHPSSRPSTNFHRNHPNPSSESDDAALARLLPTLLSSAARSPADSQDIWRLCSKAKDALPNGARLENLSWRLMHMSLSREKKIKLLHQKEAEEVGGMALDDFKDEESSSDQHALSSSTSKGQSRLHHQHHHPTTP